MNLTAAEFTAILDSLVIVWRRGEEPFLAPLTTPEADQVADFIEGVLNRNPALVQVLHERFSRSVEAAPGVLVLPVASLRDLLERTAAHERRYPPEGVA